MGKAKAPKRRSGAGVAAPNPTGASAAPAPGANLQTLDGAIARLSSIAEKLEHGNWTEREDLLALDIQRKAVGDLIRAMGVRDELAHLRDLASQLEADRAERSAMESGVQFTDEAPQFPAEGSGGTN